MNKVVVLIDCRLGLEVARFIQKRGELVGVIVHSRSTRKYIDDDHLKDLSCWVEAWPHGIEAVRRVEPNYLLSVQFGFRLTGEWLDLPNCIPINVHPGFLPDNRGRAPTAWPILDGSRAGVTLHIMTEKFDEGPILARQEVPIYLEDTGDTVACRVEAAALSLIKSTWPVIGEIQAVPQEPGGAYHSHSDIMSVSLTDRDWVVVDKLRARYYHGQGLHAVRNGHLYEVKISIKKVD